MSFKLYNQFFCSSLMLPEHRKALAKHKKEAEEKHNPPCIDDQQFELWERLAQQSRQNGKQIIIKIFCGNKTHQISGVVKGFIAGEKALLLAATTGEKKIKISNIKAVE